MFNLYSESRCKLTSSKDIYDYCMGGHGVVTLESPSGVHHTYYYKRPNNLDVFPDDTRFVYAVHTVNGISKHFYLGMIEGDHFRLTRNSRFDCYADIVKGAFYIDKMMHNQSLVDSTPMNLYHEGMCCVCGRKLTSPNSIKSGVGPKCRKRIEL